MNENVPPKNLPDVPPIQAMNVIDYAGTTPSEKPPTPPMLSRWTLIPILIFILVQCVFGWSQARLHAVSRDTVGSYFIGGIFGGILFSLIPCWIGYRIFRRSTVAGSIVFVAFLVLFGASTIGQGFIVTPATRSAATRVFTLLASKSRDANAAMNGVERDNFDPAKFLNDDGSIEKYIFVLQEAANANQAYIDAGDAAVASLAKELSNAGANSFQIRKWEKVLEQRYPWNRDKPLYVARRNVLDDLIAMLRFLATHRGDWIVDPVTHRVLISRPDLDSQFQPFVEQLRHSMALEEQASQSQITR